MRGNFMRGKGRKAVMAIAVCAVIVGGICSMENMPGSFAEESAAAADESQVVVADEYGVQLLDTSEVEAADEEGSEDAGTADEMGWCSLEDAGLADAVWDFSELPEGSFDPITPEEVGLSENTVESLKVITWNSSHVLSWKIDFRDTVFSSRFTMTSGQYLNICATYSPSSASGYIAYATPDKVIHVFSSASSVNKKIQVTQSGIYRVGFCNRSWQQIKLTGYWRTSK